MSVSSNMKRLFRKTNGVLFLICISCGVLPLIGQNILLDGGFEALEETDCFEPQDGFQQTKYWYALEATPDLFREGCAVVDIQSVFWTPELMSFEGTQYAGIGSRVNSNQSYVSEGIATELPSPLQADQLYYFELQIRNKGHYQGFPDSVISCPLTPDKHIDLYTSPDSIIVVNDFSNGTAQASGDLAAEIRNPSIQNTNSESWVTVATCFTATGGEKHLGIILPLGTFGEFPACAANDTEGTFYSFYYDLDAALLQAMPQQIQQDFLFPADVPWEVDLYNQLDFPLKDEVLFQWEDNWEGATRTFTAPGTYKLDLVFPCGSIPVEINVQSVEADFNIFVPNVFSPNDDGRNDQLAIFFEKDIVVERFELNIFDRWGNQVFSSQDPSQQWRGQYNKQDLPVGIYVWALSCEINFLNTLYDHNLSGSVLLTR